ncbi:hypothetical protein D3C78_1126000 [compost metagenome]
MQLTHFSCQRRLVTYRGRHTSQKGRNLGARLRETENVINEQKHVSAFFITEVFSHCKARQSNTLTCARRLIHLSEYHRSFAEYARVFHLVVKVITFTSTLTYAGEYRDTAVLLSDVIDKLLDCNGFTYTRASEKTDFTALCIWCKQVDNFNACFKNFRLCGQFVKSRSRAVNRKINLRLRLASLVNWLAKYVKYATQCCSPNRNSDWCACVFNFHAANKTVRRAHRNCTYHVVPEMNGNFKRQINIDAACLTLLLDFDSVQNFRQIAAFELNVDDRTHDGYNASFFHGFPSWFPLVTAVPSAAKRGHEQAEYIIKMLVFSSVRSHLRRSRKSPV